MNACLSSARLFPLSLFRDNGVRYHAMSFLRRAAARSQPVAPAAARRRQHATPSPIFSNGGLQPRLIVLYHVVNDMGRYYDNSISRSSRQ
jgi:hypothetical protein